MSKNRIGQESIETIWQKSRWRQAVDKLKSHGYSNFSLKNGYPLRPQEPISYPPSYREFDSPREHHKPRRRVNDDKQPLTSIKTMKDVSCCLKAMTVAIGLLITFALILSGVGTATPYWFDTGLLNVGLFQACTKSSTCDSASTFTESASVAASTSDTWMIVTILDITGSCVLLLSLIFYCTYVHCINLDYRKVSCGVLLSVFVMIGAAAMLSGMAVMITYYFDIEKTYSFNWSFYLAAVGGGLAFITFCIMLVYVFVLAFV